jgi:hypothetical protein
MRCLSVPPSLLLLLLLHFACNPDRVQYSDAAKKRVTDLKIKRVTNADIVEAVNSWGEQMVAIAEQEANAKLSGNVPGQASEVCNLQQLPKTQALTKRYGVRISLLSATDVANPALAQKEREVLDAYLYNAEQKLPQSTNIQRIGDTLYVYNAVLPIESALCRACFGAQKQPLAVWRIAFPKREVIRHMTVKKV